MKRHGGSLIMRRNFPVAYHDDQRSVVGAGSGNTMLTISTERAQVLARLQMEFAMGVAQCAAHGSAWPPTTGQRDDGHLQHAQDTAV